MMKRFLLILALVFGVVAPVQAVQPDEILDDKALELRAREMSKGLRCLVCRNQSIDDSDADLARDLRLLVRERLIKQQMFVLARMIEPDLAAAPEGSEKAQALAALSQAVQATMASTSNRVDRVWQEQVAGLGDNRALMQEYVDRANETLANPASDEEIIAFIVDRYGEFVLLKPTSKGANMVLWVAGPIMLFGALGYGFFYLRRRSVAGAPNPLSADEQADLEKILNN